MKPVEGEYRVSVAPTSRHALFFLDLESSSRLEHLGDSIRFGASSTVATVLAAGAEVASFELQWMPELPCAYYGEVDATQRLVHTGRLAGHAVVRQLTAGARVKRARREVLLVPTPAESGDGIADEEAAAPAAEVAAERPTLAGGKRERDPPQVVLSLRGMLIQLLAPGPLPLADVLAKCEEVAHADTVRQVLGAVAQQRDGHYHLLEDAAVWNAVNPVDAGYTPEQRQAVQKQLARLKPLLASPSASLGSSWASGTDCGDLTQSVQDRAELLQRYRELRKEAETIRNRFKMMAKFLKPDAPNPSLAAQVLDDFAKSQPRLLELKKEAERLRQQLSSIR